MPNISRSPGPAEYRRARARRYSISPSHVGNTNAGNIQHGSEEVGTTHGMPSPEQYAKWSKIFGQSKSREPGSSESDTIEKTQSPVPMRVREEATTEKPFKDWTVEEVKTSIIEQGVIPAGT